MESLMEWLETADKAIDLRQKMTAVFEPPDSGLQQMIAEIDELNEQLAQINASAKPLPITCLFEFLTEENTAGGDAAKENMHTAGTETEINSASPKKSGEKDGETVSSLKAFEALPKVAENASKFFEALGTLSPRIEAVKTTISSLGELGEGGLAIGKVLAARHTGMTAADGAETVGGLIAGATGLAEATAVFGPAGWAVGGAAMVTAGLMTAAVREREWKRQQAEQEKDTKERLRAFATDEEGEEKYMGSIRNMATQEQHYWKSTYDPVKENLRKFGSSAYDLNIAVPAAVSDNTKQRLLLPKGVSAQDEYEAPAARSYYEQTFALQQRLKYAGIENGREGFNEVAIKAIKIAKDYDKLHGTKTVEMTEAATKEALSSLLHSANDGRVLQGATEAGPRHRARRPGGSFAGTGEGSGKTININLNKPMIEHFTINAKDLKEGVSDFKRQVEEVLLEILNSANAIN